MARTWTKDPDAVKDYSINWADWLATVTDTITSSTWTVPSGITADSDADDSTSTTIWLSGGTAGETYELTNEIITVGGRTENRSICIIVKEQ